MSPRNRPSPALVVAVVALIAAVGGTAIAQNAGYIITSAKQIKPSVKKTLKGKRGPRGFRGPAGAVGPQGGPGVAGANGTNGATGATGATGPRGPSDGYTHQQDGLISDLSQFPTLDTIVSRQVPAGNYVVQASVRVFSAFADRLVTCQLYNSLGGAIDTQAFTVLMGSVERATFTAPLVAGEGDIIVLGCGDAAGGVVSAELGRLSAIRVATLNGA
jgi:hypothetical protein